MSHLSLETIARLVDEAPSALEAAHLASCDACRGELQAMHEQTAGLGALPALEPPVDDWERLEQRLEEEGLIRRGLPVLAFRRQATHWPGHALRAAAAVALLVTGTLLGRGLAPRMQTVYVPAPSPAGSPVRSASDAGPPPQQQPAPQPAVDSGPVADPIPPLRLTGSPPAPRAPTNAQEALDLLQQRETDYMQALGHFATLSGSTRAEDPATRLATLESIVLTTRAALAQAPTDPVINGYHLTAVAQRDALLREAGRAADSW